MNSLKQRLLVWLLKQLKPGYLPEPIWEQMCRLNTLISVELAYIDNGKILLRRRSDEFFGDVLHIPGTMVRGNESTRQALERLVLAELGHGLPLVEPSIHDIYFKATPRGNIYHILYSMNSPFPQDTKDMYSIRKLPKNVLDYHKELIKKRFL